MLELFTFYLLVLYLPSQEREETWYTWIQELVSSGMCSVLVNDSSDSKQLIKEGSQIYVPHS